MSTVYPASERVCRECGQSKPLIAFYPKGSGRHGRSARCKDCMRAKQRRYTAALRGLSATERDAAYERWCARRDDREALALIGQARCPICKQARPLDQFYPDPSQSSGHDARCKDCARARARRYRWDPATPRKGRGQLRLFPLDKTCPRCRRKKPLYAFSHWAKGAYGHRIYCQECERQLARIYLLDNRTQIRLRQNAARKAAYRDNPAFRAAVRARAAQWYANYHERATRRRRLYARTHRAQESERRRAWLAAHPERAYWQRLQNKRRRRARLARIDGYYSVDDIRAIRAAQRGCCAYCLLPLPNPCHLDHMTSVSRGGSDWPWNLCLACPACNLRKHTKNAGQFLAMLLKESLAVLPINPPLTKATAG